MSQNCSGSSNKKGGKMFGLRHKYAVSSCWQWEFHSLSWDKMLQPYKKARCKMVQGKSHSLKHLKKLSGGTGLGLVDTHVL